MLLSIAFFFFLSFSTSFYSCYIFLRLINIGFFSVGSFFFFQLYFFSLFLPISVVLSFFFISQFILHWSPVSYSLLHFSVRYFLSASRLCPKQYPSVHRRHSKIVIPHSVYYFWLSSQSSLSLLSSLTHSLSLLSLSSHCMHHFFVCRDIVGACSLMFFLLNTCYWRVFTESSICTW